MIRSHDIIILVVPMKCSKLHPLTKKMNNFNCYKCPAKNGPNTPMHQLKLSSIRSLMIAIYCGSKPINHTMQGEFNISPLFTSKNLIKNRKQDGLFYPKRNKLVGHITHTEGVMLGKLAHNVGVDWKTKKTPRMRGLAVNLYEGRFITSP